MRCLKGWARQVPDIYYFDSLTDPGCASGCENDNGQRSSLGLAMPHGFDVNRNFLWRSDGSVSQGSTTRDAASKLVSATILSTGSVCSGWPA
jgi:hypothetical protein